MAINTRYGAVEYIIARQAKVGDGRQVQACTDLLFSCCSFDVIMWNFSGKHRLHALLPVRYGLARSTISHDNIGIMLFAFRLQMHLDHHNEFFGKT